MPPPQPSGPSDVRMREAEFADLHRLGTGLQAMMHIRIPADPRFSLGIAISSTGLGFMIVSYAHAGTTVSITDLAWLQLAEPAASLFEITSTALAELHRYAWCVRGRLALADRTASVWRCSPSRTRCRSDASNSSEYRQQWTCRRACERPRHRTSSSSCTTSSRARPRSLVVISSLEPCRRRRPGQPRCVMRRTSPTASWPRAASSRR